VTPAQTDRRQVLDGREQGDADDEEGDEERPGVGGDAAGKEQTVMITTIDTATTQATVPAVH